MSGEGNQQADAAASTTSGQSNGGDTTKTTTSTGAADTGATDWRAGLPDELKKAPSLQSLKSVEDLAKSYVNAQGVIGRRMEDLTPDQIKTFYNKLGRPDDLNGYELEKADTAKPELVDWFRKTAHEAGLSKDAANKLFTAYRQMEAEKTQLEQAKLQLQMADEQKALEKDFGPAYDERTELANRALKEFGGDELVKFLAAKGLQNNPALVKAFAKAGMMLSEGKFVEGETTKKFGMTSQDAAKQIEALRKDPEFMKHYSNPSSSRHKESADKMRDLYKIKSMKG